VRQASLEASLCTLASAHGQGAFALGVLADMLSSMEEEKYCSIMRALVEISDLPVQVTL
jgi:hypothetical protein